MRLFGTLSKVFTSHFQKRTSILGLCGWVWTESVSAFLNLASVRAKPCQGVAAHSLLQLGSFRVQAAFKVL